MHPSSRRSVLALAAAACMSAAAPVQAAVAGAPVEIHAILPLTGPASFIGKGQLEGLQALEQAVNQDGGVAGRPVKFVVQDDQSSPQVAVQLATALVNAQVKVVLGSAVVANCGAMAPLFSNGTVMYCTSPGLHPADGSFIFSSSFSTVDLIAASIKYARSRGWKRIAIITSTDASGQDAERGLDTVLTAPENHDVVVVAREHFVPSDISVSAQMSRLKATAPQLIFSWSVGTSTALIFHGAVDAGMDNVPMIASSSNLIHAQMKQYESFLPVGLFFPGVPCIAPDAVNGATKRAVNVYLNALAAIGVTNPDIVPGGSWDPGLIVVSALRKLGPDASAAQLRDYIDNLDGWVGVNGPYNFRAVPQRGLAKDNIIMVRWDKVKATWVGLGK